MKPGFRFDEQWPDAEGTAGVSADDTYVTWWGNPGGDGGRFGEVAVSQTIEDFWERGPKFGAAPTPVVDRLFAALQKHRNK